MSTMKTYKTLTPLLDRDYDSSDSYVSELTSRALASRSDMSRRYAVSDWLN